MTSDEHKELFLDGHDYIFCEICGCSSRTIHSHHIVYKSKLGTKNPHRDDLRNRVIACEVCHNKIHSGWTAITEYLIEQRGLKDLFNL